MNAFPRELDSRTADGITVTLFWHPTTDRLTVLVANEPDDELLELEVAHDEALEAFRHPYAYAEFRGCVDPAADPSLPLAA
ncbi:MAG TPA: hypothetical protein VH416_02020 [Gaiellaceae bacterium]|jgi:hypothetical protein